MPAPTKKFSFADLRAARESRRKLAMLTCYDFSTARLMQDAGVPMLLVGDSAANVVLGHDTTVPVPLRLMIELTAAVRRGAPLCMVIADMPFGTYGGDIARTLGFRNVVRMMKHSLADSVKLEVGVEHIPLIRELAGIGMATIAHLGLRPQSVGLLGGYRARGRTALEANGVVDLAMQMEHAGAAAILLEAVPAEVSQRVVENCTVPVIGCGAGPACHAHVVVTHDAIGFTANPPRFVPNLGDITVPLKEMFADYVNLISGGAYPAAEHGYPMPPDEKQKFLNAHSSRVELDSKEF